MTQIVALDPLQHRDLRVDRRASSAPQRFVQAVVTEFPQLALQYPILISKDSETGAFMFGAVVGFSEGENLFLSATGEHEGCAPLNSQRTPFYVLDGELALDLDSPRVGVSHGDLVFDESGAPAGWVMQARTALQSLRAAMPLTRDLLQTLVRLRLLIPLEVDLTFDDGVQLRLEGLYSIDQDALRALPDATVLELFRQGHMYLIHLLILSVKQLAPLAKRRNDRLLAPLAGANSFAPAY